MQKNIELLASYWTLAGPAEPHTERDYSPFDFRLRVEAAARAGFTGMGIWHSDLANSLKRYSLTGMKRIFDDNGIRHIELEFLNDWYVDGPRKAASDARRDMLFSAAQAFGAHHVKVGDFNREDVPMPKLIADFRGLCDMAKTYDTRIGFEFMPFCRIDTIDKCRQLAEGAAADNGGIIFDLWHVVKLGIPYDAVAQFPLKYMTSVEINDGYLKSMPDLVEETTQHRKLCGEGEFDVKGFVRRVLDMGYAGPWGIEVLSNDLKRRPLDEIASSAFATTLAQFPAA
ncbi:MAG TPA: sugar phosphate isomerase/epimerase [Steroidobacteraceae bacterium]|jgi:sugar phosphate isomerase/epimerase|nr:sugar phosphate isomerase/epimerase [Steroidobacteraceae bacterium]